MCFILLQKEHDFLFSYSKKKLPSKSDKVHLIFQLLLNFYNLKLNTFFSKFAKKKHVLYLKDSTVCKLGFQRNYEITSIRIVENIRTHITCNRYDCMGTVTQAVA